MNKTFLIEALVLGIMANVGTGAIAQESTTPVTAMKVAFGTPEDMNNPDKDVTDNLMSERMEPAKNAPPMQREETMGSMKEETTGDDAAE